MRRLSAQPRKARSIVADEPRRTTARRATHSCPAPCFALAIHAHRAAPAAMKSRTSLGLMLFLSHRARLGEGKRIRMLFV